MVLFVKNNKVTSYIVCERIHASTINKKNMGDHVCMHCCTFTRRVGFEVDIVIGGYKMVFMYFDKLLNIPCDIPFE